MLQLGLKPKLQVFNAVLASCARSGHTDSALQTLLAMQLAHVTPSRISITSAMKACSAGGYPETALRLFDEFVLLDPEYSQREKHDPMSVEQLFSIVPGTAIPVQNNSTTVTGNDADNEKDEQGEEETAEGVDTEIDDDSSAQYFKVPWMKAYVSCTHARSTAAVGRRFQGRGVCADVLMQHLCKLFCVVD